MKILFVCHRFPFPPRRGGKIRPFNIIRHLSQNHEVTVASIVRSDTEAHAGKGLKNFCSYYLMGKISKPVALKNILNTLPTSTPFSMGYFYSRDLDRQIKKEKSGKKYDLIFVHCSSVAQYVEDITDTPKILDFGDMDSQKWLLYSKVRSFPLNTVFSIEGKRLQQAEMALAKKFDFCTCTTKAEMATLKGYNVTENIDWFPNGVDTDYFFDDQSPYEPDTLCFIGRMDYYPNQQCMIDFCEKILPLIRSERPDVRLMIVGADPSLGIKKLGKIKGVTVTGSVPDVRPYLRKCAVNVAPIEIARGTQNKILESLAMGIPVVTTNVAAEGVDAQPGEHFLVGSNHEEFAEEVIRLLKDRELRQKLSEAGRNRMLERHNWPSSMKKLDSIIEKALTLRK